MTARDFLFVNCWNGDHRWVSEGGRPCPNIDQESQCPIANAVCGHPGFPSQPVYRCEVCGEVDYGDPGGPGDRDCGDCIRSAA